MIGFFHKISPANYGIQSYLSNPQIYSEFIETLTQICGWNEISENECVLRGCCWEETSRSCQNPIENNLTAGRLQQVIAYMSYRTIFPTTDKTGSFDTSSDTNALNMFPYSNQFNNVMSYNTFGSQLSEGYEFC
jgi:hypothetical protein